MADTPGGVFVGEQRYLGVLGRKLSWYETTFENTNGDQDTFSFTVERETRVRIKLEELFTKKAFGAVSLYDDPPALPWLGLDSIWSVLGDRKGVVTKILEPGDYLVDVNLYDGEGVGYKLTIKDLWPAPKHGKELRLADLLDDGPAGASHELAQTAFHAPSIDHLVIASLDG